MTLRQIPRSAIIPALFCLAAGIFLIQEMVWPPEMPDWRRMTANGNTSQPGAGLVVTAPLPDKRLYEAIAARPVFSESRRAAPGANTLSANSMPAPPIAFSLVGVVDAPDQRLAIISQAGNSATSVLRQGSILDGWKIIKINQTSITVQSQTTIESIKLTR